MNKVGIIGGAGPLASSLLYQKMVEESYRHALPVPEIILINYPFTRGLTLKEGEGNASILQKELRYCINQLAQQGVEIGMIACNTLHLYLDRLSIHSPLFVSLPQLVMEEAKKRGDQRLLLLATQNTCQSSLYKDQDLNFLYPPAQEQKEINRIIDRVLEGKVDLEDSRSISQIIDKLSSSLSFDAVVLGCTDLPVLHHRHPLLIDQPIYDSIEIPAKKLRGFL